MKLKIKIENLDETIEIEPGGNLRDALLENDIVLYGSLQRHLNCRGKGLCTTCQVEIVEGEGISDQHPIERARIGAGRRLACQTRVYQDVVIRTLHEPAVVEY